MTEKKMKTVEHYTKTKKKKQNMWTHKGIGYLIKILVSKSLEHRFADSPNTERVLNNILPGHGLNEPVHRFD